MDRPAPANSPPVKPDQPMSGMTMPAATLSKTPPPNPAAAPDRAIADMDMGDATGGMADMHAAAALGPYAMVREASGTSWQPDTSPDAGLSMMAGRWLVMLHATLNAVYDDQSGPRGASKAFASGMAMAMASRDVGERGRLQLRAMVSPDPFMGASGYPLLLATGETANGRSPLVDRQHPHDLFMELSASYSYRLASHASVFVYAGLPGEPAFGPAAFMHRLSIMDSPEAPISHHWVDSMHITEGVITGGVVLGRFKLEASGFKGREPDQHRYDIETPKLDSIAVRASYNPTSRIALQASWARQVSPEQLSPAVNERRWSVSAIYTQPLGSSGYWSTTAIWAQRRAFGPVQGRALDAWVLESAVHPDRRWTVYARGERIDNDELLAGSMQAFSVGKVALGVVRDFPLRTHMSVGLGAQGARNFVGALGTSYGGDRWATMGFARIKLD